MAFLPEHSITSEPWGCLPDGAPVQCWTLHGSGGLELSLLNYGGVVTRLLAPDRTGHREDVVLGFPRLEDYLAQKTFFGCIAGRVAGRITGARFSLEGEIHELAPNDPPNHLHGGREGFDTRIWDVRPDRSRPGEPRLRLTYCSPEGEEGYPGRVEVCVVYSLTADNAFVIETEATTDRATPFSLTHHSYFNLAGEGNGSIENHELQIGAEQFVPADECMTLLGRAEPVAGSPGDFRQPRRVGDVIPGLPQNHGDLYLLPGGNLRPAARLRDPDSGRMLEVRTTESCLQFYTGHGLGPKLVGKRGRAYAPYAGLCLECEGYPDGANTPDFGDIILRPGQIHRQRTAYIFSTE